jgi:hypothetical protein
MGKVAVGADPPEAARTGSSKWGGTTVGILIVIAVVWLCVRAATVVGILMRAPDLFQDAQDAPDAARGGPEDTPGGPQDTVPTDSDPVVSPVGSGDPTSATAGALLREVTRVVVELAARRLLAAEAVANGDGATPTTDPRSEWLAALRETIIASVPRPESGPACLGGRDDDAYLRGWDDAVDWVSQGRDAQPPTWGGVAYMTGWNDAVRHIGLARRQARAWPTPAVGTAA